MPGMVDLELMIFGKQFKYHAKQQEMSEKPF